MNKWENIIIKEGGRKMAKLNIDLNVLTPEAKAELSKYIRACVKEEIKHMVSEVEKKINPSRFGGRYFDSYINFLKLVQTIKEICDEA